MRPFPINLVLASLCLPALAWPADNPKYEGQTLSIPRIDTPQQIGMYQDGVMQQNQSGVWTITSFQTLGQGTVYNVLGMANVEVIKTNTQPVLVYLRVSGSEAACDHTGPERIHQRRTGSQIDVNISAPHLMPYTGWFACPQSIRQYKITVPLEIYGLPAGTYSYSVNGIATGTFSLERENRFADDCEVNKFGNCRTGD